MAYLLKDKKNNYIKYASKHVLGADNFGSIIKAADISTRTLLMTGTDETKDRDGDITTYKGWKLENFYKNPVFLWAHNYESVPLASIQRIIKRAKSKRLDFMMKFPTEGLNPFADMILELYAEKVINASSVGFIPTKWESLEDEEGGDRLFYGPPKMFTEKELLELSGCAVPSNPNAVVVDGYEERQFSGHKAKDLFSEYLKGNQIGLKKDDVLNELHVKDFQLVEKKSKKDFYNVKPDEGFEKFVEEDSEEEPEVKIPDSVKVELEPVEQTLSDYVKSLNDKALNELRQLLDIPVMTELQVSPEQKSGAVLSKKNLSFLSVAVENIQKVLDAAAKEEPDPIKEPEKAIGEPKKEDSKAIEQPNKAANNTPTIYDEILKEEIPTQVIPPNQVSQNQERALEAISSKICESLKGLQNAIKHWK